MPVLNIVSHSEEETEALAEKLARSFLPGDVVVLSGDLGSGKTSFVRGMARGMGIDTNLVNSPTYTFVNEYPGGDKKLYHFDLYRLQQTTELYEIGWEEYLSREGIVVVEWGEKAAELLPQRYYALEFKIVSETEREIDLALVQV
ncbi:tRNA (adenosine(37)-N6)-threonylcarbamoyltransferase complex ATPase subunit type 1 TsaE [candidate division GN15 bacterium]|nr:tRNA (adenosine(37)-N6)-threonylcarbamoyltransferase complex ATPase subunit type 1 TsaE [candidate division GN15 bacterium]